MNKLLNPAFEDGVVDWENGPIDNPFYWDPTYKWIRGDSEDEAFSFKSYVIQQLFNITGTVTLAKLTAWRRYESVGGNYNDGAVISRIKLQKPDSSWVTLVEETKTAETGSGNILDQENVLSHFSQEGNYILRLQTEVEVACERTNHEEKVEEPYGPWTNDGFTIDGSNCKIFSNPADQDEVHASIEKSFVIEAACHTATLTLDAKGLRQTCELPGYALFKVTLSKTGGGSWLLYDDYLTNGNWTTILNGLDIVSHLDSAGTYTLKLEAWVVSGWNGEETYYPSQAWYGNCYLNAQWYSYEYTISHGFWDDILLDIEIENAGVEAFAKVGGAWKTSQANVKVDGVWKTAKIWTKVNGEWR
jgi:hypothetical protein